MTIEGVWAKVGLGKGVYIPRIQRGLFEDSVHSMRPLLLDLMVGLSLGGVGENTRLSLFICQIRMYGHRVTDVDIKEHGPIKNMLI